MVRFGKASGTLPAVRSVLKAGVSSEKLCEEQTIVVQRQKGSSLFQVPSLAMISRVLQGQVGKLWAFLWTITASPRVFTLAKLSPTASGPFADGARALLTHPPVEACTHLAPTQ